MLAAERAKSKRWPLPGPAITRLPERCPPGEGREGRATPLTYAATPDLHARAGTGTATHKATQAHASNVNQTVKMVLV